jgi:predicted Zn-dependent protease with MMP-like domain
MRQFTSAPSPEDIEAMAARAMSLIPPEMRALAAKVPVLVQEFPDPEVEEEMGLESAFDILGLYWGTALTQKSLMDVPTRPDMIFLYRRPILDYWCETGEDLEALVRHVLIHEIGHHFGFSDADMERIENEISG